MSWSLGVDGAELKSGALDVGEMSALTVLAEAVPAGPGARLHGRPDLERVVAGTMAHLARAALGQRARAVRALLFDKTAARNWPLGWHQDRTIVVAEKLEVQGFGPWSLKQGLQHVEPPADLQSRMVTLRAHLDPCDAENAPLLIAPGTHRLGRIALADVPAVVAAHGTAMCLADAGDIWVYATPILHASDAARKPCRRRVLQVDFAAEDLPGGLRWLGV